jgi:hypothetical protein
VRYTTRPPRTFLIFLPIPAFRPSTQITPTGAASTTVAAMRSCVARIRFAFANDHHGAVVNPSTSYRLDLGTRSMGRCARVPFAVPHSLDGCLWVAHGFRGIDARGGERDSGAVGAADPARSRIERADDAAMG